MQWFKFYGAEYLSDPKMRNMTAEQHSCWIHLLCFAANSTKPGTVEHLTEGDLMLYAGIHPDSDTWGKTVGIFDLFALRKMIKVNKNVISIRNWSKRQSNQLSNAERQKGYRERKKERNALQRPLQRSNARIEENRIEENNRGDFFKKNQSENADMARIAKKMQDARENLKKKKII